MISGSIQLPSEKDLLFGDVQYNEEKHNPISSLTLWYRVLSYVFVHLPYNLGEIVFYLDLDIELIYHILFSPTHLCPENCVYFFAQSQLFIQAY